MSDLNETDRKALERIGDSGAALEQILEAGGRDFDHGRLIQSGFVKQRRIELVETTGSRFQSGDSLSYYYALTEKGAKAVGLDPTLLNSF